MPGPRSAEGIPLQLEDEVERRARIIADAYEQLYDARKATMRELGVRFAGIATGDDGKRFAVNYASCASVPVFMQAREAGDGQAFAVAVLHWLRASEGKEWIFSHLCEAAHAFRSSSQMRSSLPPPAVGAFEDLQEKLGSALCHYNHRHC